jgi:molybdate transport system substrate-binding protein
MKRTALRFAAALSFALPIIPLPLRSQGRTELRVAAAADLKFAMDSLISVFTKTNPGLSVTAVYGSSGNFYEQILNGAPFDLFFSADIDYPRKLREQNKALSDPKPYGTGQIVLWSKKVDPARAGMNSLLDKDIIKIAIANPAHAPYGKRAEESLRFYKIYDKIRDKIVLGENISQTAQFISSGAADIGIIALSLALSPAMQREGGKFWLIPPASHQPLRQGYVLLPHAGDNPGALRFSGFIGSAEAAGILQYFGFGEQAAATRTP